MKKFYETPSLKVISLEIDLPIADEAGDGSWDGSSSNSYVENP